MSISPEQLKKFIEAELNAVSDERVLNHIRTLLVEPEATMREWDYGDAGTKYKCWSVLNEEDGKGGIAYFENGFGPENPWGLVWLPHSGKSLSMGMNSGWFSSFLDAYFDAAASALPIWRMFIRQKMSRTLVKQCLMKQTGTAHGS